MRSIADLEGQWTGLEAYETGRADELEADSSTSAAAGTWQKRRFLGAVRLIEV
ncbi:hypothetical protein AB395_00006636 (plasmid) [Sinorhizobium fredii CCBAU 45436]|uniref:Uncharacterized protein n=1 Tax=Sinorhizobium fredii (strain USDA 257) TaxID=1185652 RepID=I3XFW5_SINF2|nr:hypothetical protein USDA257_p00530 [Sinorhizobium fredii USDA 257]AWI62259.1 hypothetical protein AB395_00006636 [Sinorhizobium fredii CCBAU 45436]CCE99059.1 hypothetical protein SFHH103_04584 [Sinorhizobium fredii HH103]CEO91744.1 hypothetical protein SFHH103_psfHH103d_537 [Sinorhizobium fredii HH103]